jgi:hypothetical protein
VSFLIHICLDHPWHLTKSLLKIAEEWSYHFTPEKWKSTAEDYATLTWRARFYTAQAEGCLYQECWTWWDSPCLGVPLAALLTTFIIVPWLCVDWWSSVFAWWCLSLWPCLIHFFVMIVGVLWVFYLQWYQLPSWVLLLYLPHPCSFPFFLPIPIEDVKKEAKGNPNVSKKMLLSPPPSKSKQVHTLVSLPPCSLLFSLPYSNDDLNNQERSWRQCRHQQWKSTNICSGRHMKEAEAKNALFPFVTPVPFSSTLIYLTITTTKKRWRRYHGLYLVLQSFFIIIYLFPFSSDLVFTTQPDGESQRKSWG